MFNLPSVFQRFSRIKASTPHIPVVILSQVAARNEGGEDKYLKTNNSSVLQGIETLVRKNCDRQHLLNADRFLLFINIIWIYYILHSE